MSKTHFDPYFNDEFHDAPEKTSCGTVGFWDGDCDENRYQTTSVWDNVTCKKCLKQKNKLQKDFEYDEAQIVKQMGEFVDYCDNLTQDNEGEE